MLNFDVVFSYICIYIIYVMTQTYFRNFGSIYYFFAKKLVLLIILLPLDKIHRFFCVVIYICIYICIQYRIIEPRIFSENLG